MCISQALATKHPDASPNMIVTEAKDRVGYVKPKVVSWSPHIVLHNFLSPEECEYLKAIARPRLQISTVVDIKTGKVKKHLKWYGTSQIHLKKLVFIVSHPKITTLHPTR